ncbi:MAG: PP2C family protein-serine/threonine phosphatase, partial [Pseudomonadales bacterium]
MDSEPILVADDNPVDRMILAKIIRDQGYTVIEAEDGEAALQLYRDKQPQIVLLDALMPKMDGFEVAREIKAEAEKRFTPIIFLTALTEASELAHCLDAGGDDFLSKPYNRLILQAKLEALRRVRELHQTTELQRDAIERNNQRLMQEQGAAKAIFDRIAHREYLEIDCIRYLMSPIALFNGDVLLAAPTPRRTFNLLLGDFTGHGLTASVGAMPLADSFYALTQRGLGLADIASECNRKLNSVLPAGYFCCALLAEISFDKGTIEYWCGGLPMGYLLSGVAQGNQIAPDSVAVRTLNSRHLPLGIQPADRFDATTQFVSVAAGERLVLCTDGVIEAISPSGEQFGEDRLLAELQEAVAKSACTVTALQSALATHCGNSESTDDITAVELTIVEPKAFDLVP